MTQFAQKDKGGTIYHYVVDAAPSVWDASPAPTVVLYTSTGDTLVASQSATLGADDTLSATASAKATTITLTDDTGFSVDDICILGPNASGQWEWVTVDAVAASTNILTLRDPLQYTYAATTTIKLPRLAVTLSSSDADGVYPNCRAVWSFSVSSQARTETSIFHVSAFAPRMTLRDADVLIRQPRARDILGTRQRLTQLIRDIWDRDILYDLGTSVSPGSLVAGDELRQCHLYRVLAEIALMSGDADGRERYFDLYKDTFARALQQTLIDVDNDGAIGDNDIIHPTSTGRIRRGS